MTECAFPSTATSNEPFPIGILPPLNPCNCVTQSLTINVASRAISSLENKSFKMRSRSFGRRKIPQLPCVHLCSKYQSVGSDAPAGVRRMRLASLQSSGCAIAKRGGGLQIGTYLRPLVWLMREESRMFGLMGMLNGLISSVRARRRRSSEWVATYLVEGLEDRAWVVKKKQQK